MGMVWGSSAVVRASLGVCSATGYPEANLPPGEFGPRVRGSDSLPVEGYGLRLTP
jgi:hypothetical protein